MEELEEKFSLEGWLKRLDNVLAKYELQLYRLEQEIERAEWELNRLSSMHVVDVSLKEYLERKQAELEKVKAEFEHVKEQAQRNIRILYSLDWDRRRISVRRKRFAIYRLYKHLNFTPKEIAYIIGETEQVIKNNIGKAFKELCMKDKKCIFKPFLGGRRT